MGDGLGKPLERDVYQGPGGLSSDTYFGRNAGGDDLYSAPYAGRGAASGTTRSVDIGGISTRPYRDIGVHRDMPLSSDHITRSSLTGLESSSSNSFSSNSAYSGGTYIGTMGSSSLIPQSSSPSGRFATQAPLSEPYWHRPPVPAPLIAPSSMSQSRPQDCMIIWDWDDTLMCSSAINRNRLPPEVVRELEPLLEQVLILSMRLGDSYIVTNADDLWVFESTRRFAPRVLPLLNNLSIMSARRRQEAAYPNDVFAWKRETFREVLAARGGGSLNLVVLGDSPSEMEAAYSSTNGLGLHPLVVKTVKFKEQPSCEELVEQLKIVLQDLSSIVDETQGGNRHLAQYLRPSYGGYPSQLPSQTALSGLSTYPSFGSPSRTYPGSALLIQ